MRKRERKSNSLRDGWRSPSRRIRTSVRRSRRPRAGFGPRRPPRNSESPGVAREAARMARIRVAMIAASESSFVRMDRQILEEAFVVRFVPWNGKRSIPRLVWAILRSDVTFSWFALDHAYGASRLARLFGRKSIVVVGGVDAAKVPELRYGAHIEPAAAVRSRYALEHSDRVLIVADSLREDIARAAGVRRAEIITVVLGSD